MIVNKNEVGVFLIIFYIFTAYTSAAFLGPTIYQFALYSLIGYTGVYIITSKNFRVDAALKWYFLFALYSAFTMAYSKTNSFTSGAYYHILINLVIMMSFSSFITSKKKFVLICWGYSLASFVLVVYLYMSGGLIGTYYDRLGSDIFGNANSFALYIMYAFCYSLWLLMHPDNSKLKKVLLWIIILGDLAALFFSGGKKYIIVPIVFLYIQLLYKRDKRERRNVFKNTLLIVFIGLAGYLAIMKIPMFYNAIGVRIEVYWNSIAGDDSLKDSSTILRLNMQRAAIIGWLGKPVFGNGFDMFKYLCQSEFGYFFYSHCNFTELLYNEGIVGFGIFYSMYVLVAKKFVNYKFANSPYLAFAIGAVLCQALYDYGGVIYQQMHSVLFLFMMYQALVLDGFDKRYRTEGVIV